MARAMATPCRWPPERSLRSASAERTSKSSPVMACPADAHLGTLRTEIRAVAISAFPLDAACSPLQPRIGHHGKYGEPADGEFEPVGINLRQHQAVVDDPDQERAHYGA